MSRAAPGDPSRTVRERVIAAREIQLRRFRGHRLLANARMGPRELKEFVELDEATHTLLKHAMTDLNLSARAYDRILKVARTIADLEGREGVVQEHVFEAIQYRTLDRQIWG